MYTIYLFTYLLLKITDFKSDYKEYTTVFYSKRDK